MKRTPATVAVLAAAIAVAGCGGNSRPSTASRGSPTTTTGVTSRHTSSSATASTPSTPQTSSTPATSAPSSGAQAHSAVAGFAAAYIRYLDGNERASALPDATAPVQALAGRGGVIPAGARSGTLVMVALKPAGAAAVGQYLLAARDRAHTLYATITAAQVNGTWLVTQLEPPDFAEVLARPTPKTPPPPRASIAPRTAATAFLAGYLPWLYGQGPLAAIRSASSALLSGLKAHPPNVPPVFRHLHPRVSAIALDEIRGGWRALPNITDGQETYELVMSLVEIRGRWQVTKVTQPS